MTEAREFSVLDGDEDILCPLSVCLSVTLVDHDHIG